MRTVAALAVAFQLLASSPLEQCRLEVEVCRAACTNADNPSSVTTTEGLLWASTWALGIVAGVLGGLIIGLKGSK